MEPARIRLFATTCLTAAMVCTLPSPTLANPQGGIISAGQAVISESGTTLNVHQHTDKAVIDWRSFDIAAGETTQFHQPSSSSLAVNRVNSNSASQIHGTLSANGNVVIVNQNGVLFGAGAKVDVNGLIATTADISNNVVMNSNGTLSFDRPGNPEAAIVNDGTITAKDAGLVGFVAPNVINNGVITAKLGKIELASGDTATVDLYGDTLMEVAVSEDVTSQLISNNGLLQADGGQIALTAAEGQTIVNSLIANTGTLRAQTIEQKGGVITLSTGEHGQVLHTGTIEAKGEDAGEKGGTVIVRTAKVEQQGTISVEGHAGGGTVKVDYTESYRDNSNSSINASSAEGKAGSIEIHAASETTTLEASGSYTADSDTGGDITLDGSDVTLTGSLSVQGSTSGGTAQVNFINAYVDSAEVMITAASSAGNGGTIRVEGEDHAVLRASGSYITDGATQAGAIGLFAGQDIFLLGATLSARGHTGGGTIRVGGDYQGGGNFRRARGTFVDENVRIYADATQHGDGGRVIIWADGTTIFRGTISARGGELSGNGGFVETSGKENFSFRGGKVDTRAAHGTSGMWLLDPTNIVIADGTTDSAADGTNTFSGNPSGTPGTIVSGDTSPTTIYESELEGIAATTNISLAATNNITINNLTDDNLNLAQTAGHSVTFNAGNRFAMTASDTITTAGGDLNITAAAGTSTIGRLTTGAGVITFNIGGTATAAGVISSSGGVINTGAGTLTLSGNNTFTGGLTIKAGTVVGTTSGNAFGGSGAGTITLGDSAGGSNNATLSASGSLTFANPIVLASNTTGTLTISNISNGFNPTFTGGVTGNNSFTIDNPTAIGGIRFSTASINNVGTITNIGTGGSSGAVATIDSVIGTNVTGVIQDSSTAWLALTGNNTFSSGLTVRAGQVHASTNATAFGAGTITLGYSGGSSDAYLKAITAGGLTFANPIVLVSGDSGRLGITAASGISATYSGGVTSTGGSQDLTINNTSAGATIVLSTNPINNSGAINNIGTAGTVTISGGVGSNVTAINENGTGSALTISGGLVVNAAGTTLTNSNASGSALLTVSGGVTGTGNLILNNNSAIANGITLSTTSVNNVGTVTNSGSGAENSLISAVIGTNVTEVIQNSATSGLTLSGNNTFTGSGLTIKSGTVTGSTSANAFGASNVTLGDSAGGANAATLFVTGVLTFANPIVLASNTTGTLAIQTGNLAGPTLTGGVTGNNNLSIINSSAGSGGGLTISTGVINNVGTVTNTDTGGTGTIIINSNIGSNVTQVIQNSVTSELRLFGNNSFGSFIIKRGIARIGTNANSGGAGTITLGDSAGGSDDALLRGNTNLMTFANPIVLASNTTGTLTLGTGGGGNITFSGGVTGSNNLTIQHGTGSVTLSTALVNNSGTVTNSSSGTDAATISGGIGSNVTGVIQNSTTSATNITGGLVVNAAGTTLTNSSGTALLTVSGGVTGTGNLILNNNSSTADGVRLTTTAVNNVGTITNSGTGTGNALISAAVGSNVTGITENSATSGLTVSGALTVNGSGTTLANNNASGSSVLTVSGGVSGTGNLVVNNNSAIANGITFSTNGINHTGTFTNSGSGSGSETIGIAIGSNVTGITQNSATSALTLSAANTSTGTSTVTAGTLNLGANNTLASGSAVSVGASGTFNLAGFNQTLTSITNNGAVTFGTGNTLTTSGAQTHNGTVTGSGVTLASSGGGNITATNAVNDFTGNVSVSTTGNASVADANDLSLGAVSAATFLGRALGGNLTVTAPVQVSSSAGNPLILTASGNFINSYGAGALVTGAGGRWLVYSTNPANDTLGTLTGDFRRFTCAYGGACPALGTGNGLLYSYTPTLTATPSAIAGLTEGDAVPNLTGYAYGLTGYLGSDAAADSVTGSLTGTTAYTPSSPAGSYNINYDSGSLASALGYGFSYANNATAFSVEAGASTLILPQSYDRVSQTPWLSLFAFWFQEVMDDDEDDEPLWQFEEEASPRVMAEL